MYHSSFFTSSNVATIDLLDKDICHVKVLAFVIINFNVTGSMRCFNMFHDYVDEGGQFFKTVLFSLFMRSDILTRI